MSEREQSSFQRTIAGLRGSRAIQLDPLIGPCSMGEDFEPVLLDVEALVGENQTLDQLEQLEGWLTSGKSVSADWTDTRMNRETLAWYQPLSFYGEGAGIFITTRALQLYGFRNLRRLRSSPRAHSDAPRIALVGAIAQLLTHEIFHHQIEWMGLRFDATFGLRIDNNRGLEMSPRYVDYHRQVYLSTLFQTPLGSLEEALASANEFRAFPRSFEGLQLTKNDRACIRQAILEGYSDRPVGYREAPSFISSTQNASAVAELLGMLSDPARPPGGSGSKPSLSIQRSELTRQFLKGWTLVHERKSGVKSDMPMTLTVPDRSLKRLLNLKGYSPTKLGKGSHEVWKKPGSPMVTLPNRTNQEGYRALSTIAKSLGLRSVSELAELARSL